MGGGIWFSLASFTFAAFSWTIAPGVDTALVLRTAVIDGTRADWRTALGIAIGCLI